MHHRRLALEAAEYVVRTATHCNTQQHTGTQVVLPFGAAEYVGLGFSVFVILLITEVFVSHCNPLQHAAT